MGIPNIIPEMKKIIDSVQRRENESFQEAMEKLALKLEKADGSNVAEKLRLEAEKRRQRGAIQQLHRLPTNKGIDMGVVFSPVECQQKIKRIVLSETNLNILDEFIQIMSMKEQFEEQDVPIPNKIVMFGPPGTGKTLTAFYLACKLNLPLVLVRLDSLIDSHLGETGTNVRKVFEFAKSFPCVLFLDEFDAIGRARGTSNEVKEMSRVVNTLLQCMDDFDGDSIFIAATNLDEDLDKAVWRRFDTKMTYDLPTSADIDKHLELLIGKSILNESNMQEVNSMFNGCSFAEIEQVMLKAKRKAIIDSKELTFELIESAFKEYNPIKIINPQKQS